MNTHPILTSAKWCEDMYENSLLSFPPPPSQSPLLLQYVKHLLILRLSAPIPVSFKNQEIFFQISLPFHHIKSEKLGPNFPFLHSAKQRKFLARAPLCIPGISSRRRRHHQIWRNISSLGFHSMYEVCKEGRSLQTGAPLRFVSVYMAA